MYTSFFALKKKPFELVPNPEFMYLSDAHKKALTYLDYGIRERAGFILLTGEVGSGKTTLIQNLLKKKYEKVVVAKIFQTRVNSGELLAMINDDFGLSVAGKDRITLLRELNNFLLEQYAAGTQPILIVDEAQNLTLEVLEEVRMLSNLESPQGKLLQIMLVGQPELRQTLSSPQLLQLRQRISINCHLKALSLDETSQYILHRLTVAGNPDALQFQGDAVALIHQHTRGIPRLINIVCDFIMLSAFADGTKTVTVELVADVIRDLDFEEHYWSSRSATVLELVQPKKPETPRNAVPPELVQRVEAVEQECSVRVPNALQEVFDCLVLMKQDFGSRFERCEDLIGRCEALVADVDARLNAAAAERERVELPLETPAPPRGIMRRLFGSVASH